MTRYERMFSIFERAAQLLEHLPAPQFETQAPRILRELGREALHENGEWLLLHRERPLDVSN